MKRIKGWIGGLPMTLQGETGDTGQITWLNSLGDDRQSMLYGCRIVIEGERSVCSSFWSKEHKVNKSLIANLSLRSHDYL